MDGWFRLAEYRRRRFRRWPLAEFSLTTPHQHLEDAPTANDPGAGWNRLPDPSCVQRPLSHREDCFPFLGERAVVNRFDPPDSSMI